MRTDEGDEILCDCCAADMREEEFDDAAEQDADETRYTRRYE